MAAGKKPKGVKGPWPWAPQLLTPRASGSGLSLPPLVLAHVAGPQRPSTLGVWDSRFLGPPLGYAQGSDTNFSPELSVVSSDLSWCPGLQHTSPGPVMNVNDS